jgi:hypothetical protein
LCHAAEHIDLLCDQIYDLPQLLFVLAEFGLGDVVLGVL